MVLSVEYHKHTYFRHKGVKNPQSGKNDRFDDLGLNWDT